MSHWSWIFSTHVHGNESVIVCGFFFFFIFFEDTLSSSSPDFLVFSVFLSLSILASSLEDNVKHCYHHRTSGIAYVARIFHYVSVCFLFLPCFFSATSYVTTAGPWSVLPFFFNRLPSETIRVRARVKKKHTEINGGDSRPTFAPEFIILFYLISPELHMSFD